MKIAINLFSLILVFAVVSCKKKEVVKTTEAVKVNKVVAPQGKTLNVDPATSVLNWVGSKRVDKHNGDIKVKSGNITMNNNKIASAKVIIDMNTINVLDLKGDKKTYLESHLKGLSEDSKNDFFNVNEFPEAVFELTKSTALMNNTDANTIISGNLTLKGITKQISFKANVLKEGDAVKITTPPFFIDRTEWGIKYNTKSTANIVKDKIIADEIEFTMNIVAK